MGQQYQISSSGRIPGMQPKIPVRILELVPFAILTGLFATIKLGDSDIWWHLASGRYFWTNGRIIQNNTFSHSFPDHPWLQTQWLFDIILAGLERFCGLVAVQGFQILIVTAAFTILVVNTRVLARKIDWFVLLPIFILALSASRFRFVPRPHLITYLGLNVVIYLWIRRPKGAPIILALLASIWANCHSGVVFGCVPLLFLAVEELARGDVSGSKKSILLFGCFFIGSLFNRQFIFPYIYTFLHIGKYGFLDIAEFQAVNLSTDVSFILAATIALFMCLRNAAQREFTGAIHTILFFLAGIFYVRLIPLFFFTGLPFMMKENKMGKQPGAVKAKPSKIIFCILLLSVAVGSTVRDFRRAGPPYGFGVGVNKGWVPEGAAQYVFENRPEGKMFNDPELGGYLIWRLWPDYPVFVDGRWPAYPTEFLFQLINASREDNWRGYLRLHGVKFAVVKRYAGAGPLFEDIGWDLVYLDGFSLVYVSPELENYSYFAKSAYRILRPYETRETLSTKARIWPGLLLNDLQRINLQSLNNPKDYLLYSMASWEAGDLSLAKEFLAAGLKKFPKDKWLKVVKGKIPHING